MSSAPFFFRTLKALCFSPLIARRSGSLESGLPVHTGVGREDLEGAGAEKGGGHFELAELLLQNRTRRE